MNSTSGSTKCQKYRMLKVLNNVWEELLSNALFRNIILKWISAGFNVKKNQVTKIRKVTEVLGNRCTEY